MRKISFFLLFSFYFCVSVFAAPFRTILLTGGSGYIGSHITVELLNEGYHVIIADNLLNSKKVVIDRIKKITAKGDHLEFFPLDIRNKPSLDSLFGSHRIDAVIHLAGLKAVGESIKKPLDYYDNNLISSIYLLEVMEKYNCKNLIFSSSATVYGSPERLPLDEKHPSSAVNAYGRTKLMIEQILGDVAASSLSAETSTSSKKWRMVSLRYFNPVGAHRSGLLGEDAHGIPNNLMPYVLQVVVGQREKLNVFGGDYPTPDGTAMRDFIHVVDLAQGHLATLHKLENDEGFSGHKVYNLGTGKPYSVLDLVKAVSEENKRPVPYEIVGRREGDVGVVFADPTLAERELGWKAKLGIKDMAKDSLNWIIRNPHGYPDSVE